MHTGEEEIFCEEKSPVKYSSPPGLHFLASSLVLLGLVMASEATCAWEATWALVPSQQGEVSMVHAWLLSSGAVFVHACVLACFQPVHIHLWTWLCV